MVDADAAHTQAKSVCSECNGPELEADTLADRQPVQLTPYVSGTGTTWSLSYHTGKLVLDTLKMVEVALRGAVKQTVTVVEMRTDDAHCGRFGSIKDVYGCGAVRGYESCRN